MPGTRPTASARGYGYAHQKRRKRAAKQVAAGEAYCWRCLREGRSRGEAWIAPDQPWDLGHDDEDRDVYCGPECLPCNRGTGRRRATRKRPTESHPGLL